MIYRRLRPSFGQEPSGRPFTGAQQQLESDPAVQLGIVGQVDPSHASFAEQRFDSIAAPGFAGYRTAEGGGWRSLLITGIGSFLVLRPRRPFEAATGGLIAGHRPLF